jgi:hypothetical protein
MSESQPQKIISFCPHCGNKAPQRVAYTHRYRATMYGVDGTVDDDGPTCEAILCICETCSEVLLYDGFAEIETGCRPELSYPRGPRLHRSVPKRIQDVYEEASRIKQQAPNAFAVMIRRALEEICDERQVPRGRLVKRLAVLAKRGDIPPTLAGVTDVLRVVGNTGAHAKGSVTAPHTWALDDFFRAVVEYVYVAPHKLAEFREKLSRLPPEPLEGDAPIEPPDELE